MFLLVLVGFFFNFFSVLCLFLRIGFYKAMHTRMQFYLRYFMSLEYLSGDPHSLKKEIFLWNLALKKYLYTLKVTFLF